MSSYVLTTATSTEFNQDSIYDEIPDVLREQLKANKKTLLDQEFIKLSQNYPAVFGINIDAEERRKIIDIVREEVKFLKENNIMDYSILLGIE